MTPRAGRTISRAATTSTAGCCATGAARRGDAARLLRSRLGACRRGRFAWSRVRRPSRGPASPARGGGTSASGWRGAILGRRGSARGARRCAKPRDVACRSGTRSRLRRPRRRLASEGATRRCRRRTSCARASRRLRRGRQRRPRAMRAAVGGRESRAHFVSSQPTIIVHRSRMQRDLRPTTGPTHPDRRRFAEPRARPACGR